MTTTAEVLYGLEDVEIQRDKGGNRVFVSLLVERCNGGTTINHEHVDSYLRVRLTGVVVRKGGQFRHDGDWISCGQIDPSYLPVRLARLWQRWHLNDLRSHCIHQDPSVKWDEVPPCPTTGYKAGSAWLVELIDEATVADIIHEV